MKLTGISMKDGGSIPGDLAVFVNKPGTLLTLTDTHPPVIEPETTGAVYKYYVEGDGKQTEDPEIHNQGE